MSSQFAFSSSIFGVFCILAFLEWITIMDDWSFDEKWLSKWHKLQCCKSMLSNFFWQGTTNNVRFTFSVVILHMRFTIGIELDKRKLVIVNSVTNPLKRHGSNTKSKGHDILTFHNPWFGARERLMCLAHWIDLHESLCKH